MLRAHVFFQILINGIRVMDLAELCTLLFRGEREETAP